MGSNSGDRVQVHFELAVNLTCASSQVVEHVEELTAVSVEATQEAALEELLARVTGKWANIEFAVHPYKDTKDVFILGGVDDVITVLEDSMLTMSTILASR